MSQARRTAALDPPADPFHERAPMPWRKRLSVLGARFQFESDSRELLQLVSAAYEGLAPHRVSRAETPLRIQLRLVRTNAARNTPAPPMLRTLAGPGGLLCGLMDAANFAILSPHQRSGLVAVSQDMLSFPYHVRYELIEFAVFTLASRVQRLVPLHAACIGRDGRGLLLMGSSGAGKSTLALHCLMQGMDLLAEDSVFVRPAPLLATGVPNFLHLRRDSLRFLGDTAVSSQIERSPVIQRRSGVKKFEIDLRQLKRRRACSPLRITGVIFLSTRRAGAGEALRPLGKRELLARLTAAQPYAAEQPTWNSFSKRVAELAAFELRRGPHPAEAAAALRQVLQPSIR
jgi:hypothetical protein